MIKVILNIILICLCSKSYAFDIADVPLFNKSIDSKETILVGFVKNISITNTKKGMISAQADILVQKCLLGDSCSENTILKIDYLPQVVTGTSISVNLPIAEQVILMLNKKIKNNSYTINSNIAYDIDSIYVCNIFPYSILDENRKFQCSNTMMREITKIMSLEEIKQLGLNNEDVY